MTVDDGTRAVSGASESVRARLLQLVRGKLYGPLRAVLRETLLWRVARFLWRVPEVVQTRLANARVTWEACRVIKGNGLFDAAYYLSKYPKVAALGGTTPLRYFVTTGAALGHDPHPLFDNVRYLRSRPEVVSAGVNPLLDYLQNGAALGLDPSPLFDTSYYLETYRDVAEANVNPLAHFVQWGAAARRKPCPLFDTPYYLATYPEVAEQGVNPLVHYLLTGASRGYWPNPLFDPAYYANQCALSNQTNPLIHFLEQGAAAGKKPHPLFDTIYYLRTYPDVAATGVNPLADFLEKGAVRRRNPNPLFDTDFYLRIYPEVEAAGVNPLVHYINWGADQRRQTSLLFDTGHYLDTHPEVALLGVNPLAHCLSSHGSRSWVGPVGAEEDGFVVAPAPLLPAGRPERPLALPSPPEPAVSVVVPVGQTAGAAWACLASLAQQAARVTFEVIAVRDPMHPGEPDLAGIAGLILVDAEAGGVAAAWMQGAAVARGRRLVFLAPGVRTAPGWLDALIDTFEVFPDAGLVGSLVVGADGRIDVAGGIFYRDAFVEPRGVGGHPDQPRFSHTAAVDYCPAGQMISAALFRQLGGVDRRCLSEEAAAIDLGLRLRAAKLAVYCQPQARLEDPSGAADGDGAPADRPPFERRGVGTAYRLDGLEAGVIDDWRSKLADFPDSALNSFDLGPIRGTRRLVVVTASLPDWSPGQDRPRLLVLLQMFAAFGFQVTVGAMEPVDERTETVRALEFSGIRVIRGPFNGPVASFVRLTASSIDLLLLDGPAVARKVFGEIAPVVPLPRRILYGDGMAGDPGPESLDGSPPEDEGSRLDSQVPLAVWLRRNHGLTLVASRYEAELLRKLAPERAIGHLAPVVTARADAGGDSGGTDRPAIGLTGDFSRWQDVEATVFFVLNVWPKLREHLPGVVLRILATTRLPAAVRALAADDVEMVAKGLLVPAALGTCRLVVFPVRYWRGFCEELAQVLANGLPAVVSPTAARGMDLMAGDQVVIADPGNPAAFAAAVAATYRDRSLLDRLSAAGLEHARGHWSLEVARRHLIRGLHLAGIIPTAALSDRIADEARAAAGAGGRRLPDVLVFPVIDWHFRFQRPQHLALGMARRGHRVFYFKTDFIPPGVERPYLFWEQAEPNLFIVQLNVGEASLPICQNAPSARNVARLLESLEALRRDCAMDALISFVDLPFWRQVARALPGNLLVYDCMDYHPGFHDNHADMLDEEHQLISDADLVITTSLGLSGIIGKVRETVLIRNACEVEHFAKPRGEVRHLSDRPVVGYFGAIAHWYDIDLVVKAAQAYPDWHFVLIGNTRGCDTAEAETLPNIEFLQEVPYDILPGYLHAFDICIIPFKLTELILYTNPVKLYEYLAAGKPVVATAMPEVMAVDAGLAHVGVDPDDFVAKLAVAMAERDDDELRRRRIAWAHQQTWTERVALLDRTLETYFPRVSVIVLTYNNLALTKACLASLEEHSHYPNLELVIVDNASSDGSRDFLADYGRRHPEAKVILNEANLGFSAGNNVGLRAATGEYLVMLNNDTQVTEGWVFDLLRHLRRDPTIGLIGPVTNNIGNEAKIDISYSSASEMHRLAFEYCSARRLETLELRTVAFFCVMMPRAVFETVGFLDEIFGVGMFEDDDYCNRVRAAGYRIVVADDVFIHHELSASLSQLGQERRQRLFEENKRLYEAKWGPWIPHRYRALPASPT